MKTKFISLFIQMILALAASLLSDFGVTLTLFLRCCACFDLLLLIPNSKIDAKIVRIFIYGPIGLFFASLFVGLKQM